MTLAPDTYVCHCDCHRRPEYLPHRKPCCLEFAERLLRGELNLNDREISVPNELSSMSVLVPDRMHLIEAVREWADASRMAREEYIKAVKNAREAGIGPREIGIAAGVTDGAIRMLLKRS